jgi:hypothetical protein
MVVALNLGLPELEINALYLKAKYSANAIFFSMHR